MQVHGFMSTPRDPCPDIAPRGRDREGAGSLTAEEFWGNLRDNYIRRDCNKTYHAIREKGNHEKTTSRGEVSAVDPNLSNIV